MSRQKIIIRYRIQDALLCLIKFILEYCKGGIAETLKYIIWVKVCVPLTIIPMWFFPKLLQVFVCCKLYYFSSME